MTSFGVLLQVCGLTAHDAAHYLKVPPRVVMRYVRGTAEPSEAVLTALGALHARQQDVADAIITSWDQANRPAEIAISVAKNDEDARAMGWPSLAAQSAPVAIAQAVLAPIRVTLEVAAPEAEDLQPTLDLAVAGIAAE